MDGAEEDGGDGGGDAAHGPVEPEASASSAAPPGVWGARGAEEDEGDGEVLMPAPPGLAARERREEEAAALEASIVLKMVRRPRRESAARRPPERARRRPLYSRAHTAACPDPDRAPRCRGQTQAIMAAPDLETLDAVVDPEAVPHAGGAGEGPATGAPGEAAGEQRADDPAVGRGGSEGQA